MLWVCYNVLMVRVDHLLMIQAMLTTGLLTATQTEHDEYGMLFVLQL